MFKSVLNKLSKIHTSGFHTTSCLNEVQLLTRLRVVDNSEIGKRAMAEGKPPKVICVYNKKRIGYIGDRVMVAIKGQKKKGILVGLKQTQNVKVPKFDSNNIVLIDDNGTPSVPGFMCQSQPFSGQYLKREPTLKEQIILNCWELQLDLYR